MLSEGQPGQALGDLGPGRQRLPVVDRSCPRPSNDRNGPSINGGNT